MELTPKQITFMRGQEAADSFEVWWPLLMNGLIRPSSAPPPLFTVTEQGDEALAVTE